MYNEMNINIIELNGNTYQEADRGRFEASLIDNGVEIAYTECGSVVMLSGDIDDVTAWADSYDISDIKRR